MGLDTYKMFDKIINISFSMTNMESVTFDNVFTPLTGRKPKIAISGKLIGNSTISALQLRITNYYPSQPLSNYKRVSITAGYKNGMYSTFTGEIFSCFISSHPPDKETTFTVIIGHQVDYLNIERKAEKVINKNYSKDTSNLVTILNDIISVIDGCSIVYQPATYQAIVAKMDFPQDINLSNCSASEAFLKVQEAFPEIAIRVDGDYIYVIEDEKGTGIIHSLDYILSARDDSGSFTIVAPWNPQIRPYDNVQANPIYFATLIGSMNLGVKILRVVNIDFSFATCSEENQMTLFCVRTI